ncbi:DUF3800 domain-containing protein [Nostoc sp. NIES-2111]
MSVYADEAGCFGFHRRPGATKHFLIVTVELREFGVLGSLLDLRRDLIAHGDTWRDKLHATEDAVSTRARAFAIIRDASFVVDCTILEKAKAHPQTRMDEPAFYRYAWSRHCRYLARRWLAVENKVVITAAALGSHKTRAAFKAGINEALQVVMPRDRWEVAFLPSSSDPGLWIADYCAWAILRKWERGDTEWYDVISGKIRSEFDIFRQAKTFHY